MHAVFDERRYLIPFRATLLPQIFTDVLVVGAGVAGTCAALSAVRHDENAEVIIAAKGQVKDSNTYWAQGGIAAVLDDDDTDDVDLGDDVLEDDDDDTVSLDELADVAANDDD